MSSPHSLAQARADSARAHERASFVITPHQSFSDRAAFTLYGLLVGIAVVSQIPILALGWWPISVFCALDTFGLICAFHVHRVCQRRRSEEVVVESGFVRIRRVAFRRPVQEIKFDCYGLCLIRSDDPDFGCRHLYLSIRGRRTEIARDLSPEERKDFAEALWKALKPHSVTRRTEVAQGWADLEKGPYAP
jgi:uncharacterized membrane protein